jgi:hypothetical protein
MLEGAPFADMEYDFGNPLTVGCSLKEKVPKLCVPPKAATEADRPARFTSELVS